MMGNRIFVRINTLNCHGGDHSEYNSLFLKSDYLWCATIFIYIYKCAYTDIYI